VSTEIIAALIGAFAALLVAGLGAIGEIVAAAVSAGTFTLLPRRAGLRWIIAGLVVGTLVGVLVGGFAAGPIEDAMSRLKLARLPLQVLFSHDFEDVKDPTEIAPWKTHPEAKGFSASISDDESHSGGSSLRLHVQMQEYDPEDHPEEYAGITTSASHDSRIAEKRIAACVAWVLIPESEAVPGKTMRAHMYGGFDYEYENVGYVEAYSEDVKLDPGSWTPVFWGPTYSIYSADFAVYPSPQRLDAIFLSVRDSSNPYSGYIYIDDFVCYSTKQ
jgi:hypothetical protein